MPQPPGPGPPCRRRPPGWGARLLGPAPCAIPRIHRKHRWHLVFKAWRVQEIMPLIRNYLGSRPAAGLQITVDADPVSML